MTIWPYQTIGSQNNLPLVFLHGFMGRGADWLPVAERLTGRFYCLMPDLPGHGDNTNLSLSTALGFDSITSGLVQWLDQLGLNQISLVGYSMGGRIALYVATHFPDRINTLILESANPGLADPQARQARAKVDDERAQALLRVGLDVFVDQWYEMGLFSSLKQYPYLLEQTKAKRKQNDPRWMAKIMSELSPGRQLPLWDKLGNLPMPVVLMAGALDAKYTRLIQKMETLIPNAVAETVPKAGHNIHLEQPDIFAGIIYSQLTGQNS